MSVNSTFRDTMPVPLKILVAVLQEAEERLSRHTEADDSYQRFDVSTLKGEKE